MRGLALLVASCLLATAAVAALPATSSAPRAAEPLAVVAHIDVGINPYATEFRWSDPRASQHPCTYIAAYPCSSIALPITLDEPDWDAAFAKDAALWAGVQLDTLYWFPGTKILGAISFNDHGSIPILDEDGHGTMTATRSAGGTRSLCEACVFVSVEGLGGEGVSWAADSGFVDVQTNSWGSLSWFTRSSPLVQPIMEAAAKHIVLFASGNGYHGFDGYVSSPTYTMGTGAPGAIFVGAHDNGHVLSWPGSPPHVIADGYGGWTAFKDRVGDAAPAPGACCTSAASPYAAGGAGAIVLESRRVLGDPGPGIRDGVVARGPAGLVPGGPLQDGLFTLAEFREVFFRTATVRPVEGPDDGLLHWLGGPDASQAPPLTAEQLLDPAFPDSWFASEWADNPFCPGCWSTPLEWKRVPGKVSWWDREGYGAIDPASVGLATHVLHGHAALPDRPLEDALYALDQDLRHLWWFGAPPSP